MADFNIPNITDSDLDNEKSKKQIKNYLYQLTEQLRYVLNNLDADNLSEGLSEQIAGIAALQLEADKNKSDLAIAITNATELLTAALNGYVIKRNGEILIMDTEYPETATKVWRWNLNGLGYSSSGINGPYGTAITMDGNIVANYITTGVLTSILIQSDNYTQDGSGNPLTGMKIDLNAGSIKSKYLKLTDSGVEVSGGKIELTGDLTTPMFKISKTGDATNYFREFPNGLQVFLNNSVVAQILGLNNNGIISATDTASGKTSQITGLGISSDGSITALGGYEVLHGWNDIHSIRHCGTYLEVRTTSGEVGITYNVSDARLKDHITDTLACGMNAINQIKHRQFEWNDTSATPGMLEANGYIAQELEAINPEFVLKIDQEDGSTHYQVDIFKMMPYLTKGMQEMSADLASIKEILARNNIT